MSQVAGALGHRPVSELKGVGPKMAEKLRDQSEDSLDTDIGF